MTDAALLDAVRLAVRAEVEPLRRALERLAPPPPALRPADAGVVEALAVVFGQSAVTSREIVSALRLDIGDRTALRTALERATGGFLTAQAVGHVLRRICDAGGRSGGWRLTAAGAERGARVFVLELV